MTLHIIGRASALPLALAIIPSLPRPALKRLVTRMIERIDQMDGDADLEEDNEDCGEDENEPDFRKKRRSRKNESGPGCSISDADFGGEEIGEPIDGICQPTYGIDQSAGPLLPYAS